MLMLVIATAFSAVATTITKEKSPWDQNRSNRGGLFTQLPKNPGYDVNDWFAYHSAIFCGDCYQSYEMFTDVGGPIQGIHWWGMSCIDNDSSYTPGDPVGMTFNITFYQDNNTKPGEIFYTYSNVHPTIIATGVLYPESPPNELYFFEYNLSSSCDLSTGWVSIFSTGSENNCSFFWMESSTGDRNAFNTLNGNKWDSPRLGLSLVLTDGTKSSLEIVEMKGGFGVSLGIQNTGNDLVKMYPIDFIVQGGILKKIDIRAGGTISSLAPGDTTPLATGMFFGFGKLTIFVVGDGMIAYKQGKQLLLYTLVQNT